MISTSVMVYKEIISAIIGCLSGSAVITLFIRRYFQKFDNLEEKVNTRATEVSEIRTALKYIEKEINLIHEILNKVQCRLDKIPIITYRSHDNQFAS